MKTTLLTKIPIRIVTIACVGIFSLLALGTFNHVHAAASLYLTASTTTAYPGGTFTIYPRVNTGGTAANAFKVTMTYSSIIQAISSSKGGSICSLYAVEPSYTSSTARFECGLPHPGYTGSSGGLGSFTFRALSKGMATISITGSSQVLADDGVGTNILGSTGSITINIVDPPPPPVGTPKVTCTPGKDGKWINVDEVSCEWTTPSGADGFSYIITKKQSEDPPQTSKGMVTSKSFKDLEDGVYYIKVMATKDGRWGNPVTYTLKVDTTPPENLEIVSDPLTDGKITELPMISFNATDATSGIDHYEIKIDDGEWIVTENPYQFETITSGDHTIYVKAVDKAGNETIGSLDITVAEIDAPVIIKPKQGAYIPIGEKLEVEGTAAPGSTVYIYLNGEQIGETIADEDGNFSFTYDKILTRGSYELYATSMDDGGIMSQKSEVITFNIDMYAVKIGSYVVPSICVGSVLLILLILFILLIVVLVRKYKSYRQRVNENVGKAEGTVQREFDELEDDVREEIEKALSKKVGKKDLRNLENKLEKEIREEIDEAERDITDAVKKVPPEKAPKRVKSKDIPPNENIDDTLG